MNERPDEPDVPPGAVPSGLPNAEDEITPLGGPADEDDGDGRGRDGEELPGMPRSEPDTAG